MTKSGFLKNCVHLFYLTQSGNPEKVVSGEIMRQNHIFASSKWTNQIDCQDILFNFNLTTLFTEYKENANCLVTNLTFFWDDTMWSNCITYGIRKTWPISLCNSTVQWTFLTNFLQKKIISSIQISQQATFKLYRKKSSLENGFHFHCDKPVKYLHWDIIWRIKMMRITCEVWTHYTVHFE